MRWGDRLEFSGEAGPGDFIYVPPFVPHQEINARADEPCEAVVVRSGQDPIVVNLDLASPSRWKQVEALFEAGRGSSRPAWRRVFSAFESAPVLHW